VSVPPGLLPAVGSPIMPYRGGRGWLAIERGCGRLLGSRTAIRRTRLFLLIRGPLGGIRRSGPCPGSGSRAAGVAMIALLCVGPVSVAVDIPASLGRLITFDARSGRCRRSRRGRGFGCALRKRHARHHRERRCTREPMSRHFDLTLKYFTRGDSLVISSCRPNLMRTVGRRPGTPLTGRPGSARRVRRPA
jgi:hypothetical protein